MELDVLVVDLAIILSLAALTTLLFKWLKLPVVLGYILAGYLASNHFSLLPTVSQVGEINTLAELGVIFLLFSLGLDFSFRKLLRVGGASVIAAMIIVSGMMLSGFVVGKLLLWSTADSVFLGGMLSMSSTTIIYKQLSDSGALRQKFAGIVFGVLVVEDLVAILMLVLLSTIYVGKSFSGGELAWSVVRLMFFLMVWFGVGIYLIPTILSRARKFLTGETLLMTSIGLCLAMVYLAHITGFSPALGAFIMGSILAETPEAPQIERQTKPISDLFGAIFFVSVGMMVDPAVIVLYWPVILLLVGLVLFGQIFFATCGILLSGRPLDSAVRASFSLAQIGEFSFIIATLGVTLSVTSSFLFPVIVSVSVVTIFLTPFVMRCAEPVLRFLQRVLPDRALLIIENYSSGEVVGSARGHWQELMLGYLRRVLIFGVLLSGLTWLIRAYLVPFVDGLSLWGFNDIFATMISLLIIAPFVWALGVKPVKPNVFIRLWTDSNFNRGLIISLIFFRVVIAFAFVVTVLVSIHSYRIGTIIGISVIVIILLVFSRRIAHGWRHFEAQFRHNMGQSDQE